MLFLCKIWAAERTYILVLNYFLLFLTLTAWHTSYNFKEI
uniref:Uncharacterized protein n=1 Tax=Rhizophora mucronata TaxID=61149 RepID=A0A2P2N0F0_RHIMU